VLEVDADGLSRSSRFAELDVDSLALVEVAEIVEEQLAPYSPVPLHIPDADLAALQTLGDTVDYAMERL
jgi:acyl carrier protein